MIPNNMRKTFIKRLFWDIETAPCVVYSWGVGYNLTLSHENIVKERKIICIAYKWQHESRVTVLTWDSNQDDRAMLAKFIEVANEADELVAHHGNHFDMPWLRTRCLLHGLDPIPIYKTVDTKALAGKYFYFCSNKLDYLSKAMGFGGKIKTDFQLWVRVMQGDTKALAYMARYCGVDVVKLQKVFTRMAAFVKPKSHVGVLNGDDKFTCPHCGCVHVGHDKVRTTAAGTVQHQMRCRACHAYYTINEATYKRYLER